MKCPVCKDVTLLMSEKKGVEIDYCPGCRGIWLDRGELEKILEKEEKTYQEVKHDQNKENYDDKKHGFKKKRKSSFISEVFEMFGD